MHDLHLDLLEDLDMPQALRAEAAACLQSIEAEGFIRGILPAVFIQTLRRVRGDAAATQLQQLADQLDGPYTLSKPMRLRDLTFMAIALWCMAWPERTDSLRDAIRHVVRACIDQIISSPGFSIMQRFLSQGVLDQALPELAGMSEVIAPALSTFKAKLTVCRRDYVEIRYTDVSPTFTDLCIGGYFEGLLDLCKMRGVVRCVVGEDGSSLLVIDARASASSDHEAAA